MATILLTTEEYNHIQGVMNDLFTKATTASPRAATHYEAIARQHADFLAKEDGKRAVTDKRREARNRILSGKQARRNKANAQQQAPQPAATTHTTPTQKSA